MKKSISCVFVALMATLSYGQGSYAIKIYQNSDFFHTYQSTSGVSSTTRWAYYNRISLALAIRARKFTHEIELFIPDITRSSHKTQFPLDRYFYSGGTGYVSTTSSYCFRYEVSTMLSQFSKRLSFNLGLGLNPYYTRTWNNPTVPNTYSRSLIYGGAAINIIPRILFKINDRFGLDLNAPFRIFDAQVVTQHISNPAIPIRQQTSTEPDYIFFRKIYNIRLGLVYRLGVKERPVAE